MTWSSTSTLIGTNARQNVDSSAGPRTTPNPASTSAPASAAHWPIAANNLEPAVTVTMLTASSPASQCRRPRLFRGSGNWEGDQEGTGCGQQPSGRKMA
jgi:hypothetical protein